MQIGIASVREHSHAWAMRAIGYLVSHIIHGRMKTMCHRASWLKEVCVDAEGLHIKGQMGNICDRASLAEEG